MGAAPVASTFSQVLGSLRESMVGITGPPVSVVSHDVRPSTAMAVCNVHRLTPQRFQYNDLTLCVRHYSHLEVT